MRSKGKKTMRNSDKCIKCESSAVVQVDNQRGSQFNPIKTGMLTVASITRYVCCDCGYIEDWIDNQFDLNELKKKHFPNE